MPSKQTHGSHAPTPPSKLHPRNIIHKRMNPKKREMLQSVSNKTKRSTQPHPPPHKLLLPSTHSLRFANTIAPNTTIHPVQPHSSRPVPSTNIPTSPPTVPKHRIASKQNDSRAPYMSKVPNQSTPQQKQKRRVRRPISGKKTNLFSKLKFFEHYGVSQNRNRY